MFKWRDYLLLAEELSRSPREECKRTAISRAYYAAFRSASDYYLREWKGYPPPKDPKEHLGSHEVVWAAYQNARHSKNPRYGKVGSLGDSLKDLRVYADYRQPFPIVEEGLTLDKQVEVALRTARELFKHLAAIEAPRQR